MLPGSKTINSLLVTKAKKVFSFFSSLKTAIPLLVITIAVTIAASLLPTTDFFKTWWYMSLLGLNGVSLLFITILHTPMILERKGRNALIGVVVTHLGILILIAGAIYGLSSGFRHEIRAIEGEMTVVADLPFVIRLDQLVLEAYPAESVAHLDPEVVPRKRQESHLTLYRSGKAWFKAVAAPGKPVKVDGITILPAFKEVGRYFELIVTDKLDRQKTIAVKPWSPPIFQIDKTPVMAHALVDTGVLSAQIFTMVDEQMSPLGMVSQEQDFELNGYTVSLGPVKNYTGLIIYNRPHAPVLVIGCLAMLFGLVWHFYFRHRDRGGKNKGKEQMDGPGQSLGRFPASPSSGSSPA